MWDDERSDKKKKLFESYVVGEKKIQVDLLQYVDDTIFMGEATLSNISLIKSILRCFELGFRLKINFFKSKVGAIGWERRSWRGMHTC